MFNIFHAAGIC